MNVSVLSYQSYHSAKTPILSFKLKRTKTESFQAPDSMRRVSSVYVVDGTTTRFTLYLFNLAASDSGEYKCSATWGDPNPQTVQSAAGLLLPAGNVNTLCDIMTQLVSQL